MAAFTYTKPTVGGSEDTWGTTLNANWDALGTFLGALDSTELALLDGATIALADITATAAELNILDGVTATTAELNILDGVPLTTNLSYVDGVTSAIQTQLNALAALTPAGTVINVAMNTAPTGYLKANGAAVSRTTYAALFAAIGTTFGAGDGSTTFNVPDLRGEFVRGWDDARGVDSSRVFGSFQDHALEEHRHGLTGSSLGTANVTDYVGGNVADSQALSDPITGVLDGNVAAETRPRNVALLACIKV